jgi:hypothetical protein
MYDYIIIRNILLEIRYRISIYLQWYIYQLHGPSFNSSKDINLDSQNDIYEPEYDALSNGAAIAIKLLQEI